MLQNPLSKLVKLDLSNSCISDEGAAALGGGLKKNNKLKKLTVQRIESITPSGWAAFFRGMSNSNSSLNELDLEDNDEIGDEGAVALSGAFAGNNSLKCLDLSSIKFISTNNWIALLKSLFNPDSVLEKLYMYNNDIDDEVVTFLGGALVNNATLKSLSLMYNRSITERGWAAFFGRLSNRGWKTLASVLCNKSSIDSIYRSNHTLQDVGWINNRQSSR